MDRGPKPPDIESSRLSSEDYADNFSDLHPLLSAHQASIEASRCYYCFDAPCINACPTNIDIPSFIQKISTGNIRGSAKKILEENIFGAMCARVCPTEVLCEQACVRTAGENKPVTIGALQRFATEGVITDGTPLFERGPESGKHVAVVGAGPAGLSCAHRLAMLGHRVTVFEAQEKPGGLNEYGIAAYKVVDNIAQREIDYILEIGGIDIRLGEAINSTSQVDELRKKYDAVFIGLGLGGVRQLGLESDGLGGVMNAVEVRGCMSGPTLYYGAGAGPLPTASAVVADLMELARGGRCGVKRRVPPLGTPTLREVALRRKEDLEGEYYLRFTALDRPGVLSHIAGALGQQGISIASLLQLERHASEAVPVVMMTHPAKEAALRTALAEISRMGDVTAPTQVIPVEREI